MQESKENSFSQFTNLYSLSKSLRFELKPVGETLENLEKNGILSQDECRAEEYKKVKKIIDEYHKHFIEKSLKSFSFAKNILQKYEILAKNTNKDDMQRKEFESIQSKLRKRIAKKFKTKRLFGKELIQKDLSKFLKKTDLTEFYKKEILNKQECLRLVGNFSKWTAHFIRFNENRGSMYSAEEKPTAISYRLINDNLPKFIGNISVFEKIKDKLQNEFNVLQNELGLSENMDCYFNLNNYNKFLTQSEIDLFNSILGGRNADNGTKLKGLNEYINLYNQKQIEKKDKLPKFTQLFKMILSDKTALSWLPEQFEGDNEVLEAINEFYSSIAIEKDENGQIIFEQMKKLLQEIKFSSFDLNKIYLQNDANLADISQKFLGHWGKIQNAVEAKYEKERPMGRGKSQEKYNEEKEKYFKRFDSFSLAFINECTGENIDAYFAKLDEEKDDAENITKKNLFEIISEKYNAVECLLNVDYPTDKKLSQDKDSVEKIKGFLDAIMDLLHFVKPLNGKGNEVDKDEKFYSEFTVLFEKIKIVAKLYDKVRNFMTKKPYSTEKIKLSFENSTLCNGWDVNKEQDNTAVLMRKNGLFYLAIMNYKQRTKFSKAEIAAENESFYEKIDYKLLPSPNKMLPKVFFSAKGKEEFNPSIEILEDYQNERHKKGGAFDRNKMCKLIDFFKDSITKHEDWKKFNFKFSETSSYESIDKFYAEVTEQGYKITFRNISEKYINKLVEESKLYLFQIYNKDFSEHSKGTPNMHTLYWRELFSDDNLKNIVYKLNGEAEIFYRKSSIKPENVIVHEANKPIENKNKQNIKPESTFDYDLIKDRRYTMDKFLFHCTITLNFRARGKEYINEEVNNFIRQNGINHIIGIDRGERNLLYISVIDLNGNIKEQFSLNEIVNEYNGNKYKINYHKLLNAKEADRTKQRKEWQTIESIKELKEGYLSQVVHKITDLIVKYKAIVVLEDLNFGFMRGRQKFEKSVYQQFEKKLIDKLNYLVFKKIDKNEIAGALNALQLANKFKSLKKLGKQCGFLFYVSAWNTSKIDPLTGFVSFFDCRFDSIEKARVFFSKFYEIRFNKDKDYFEFLIDDYSKFSYKVAKSRKNWTICTNGERIKTYKNPKKNNQWDYESIVLTAEFKKLFEDYKIDFNSDLRTEIIRQNEKPFFENLLSLFKLTVLMRNFVAGTDIDYMISSVANEHGEFFDSSKKNINMPENADANGAYNIARKGLMLVEKIKNTGDAERVDLVITNKEYLQFVQNHIYHIP